MPSVSAGLVPVLSGLGQLPGGRGGRRGTERSASLTPAALVTRGADRAPDSASVTTLSSHRRGQSMAAKGTGSTVTEPRKSHSFQQQPAWTGDGNDRQTRCVPRPETPSPSSGKAPVGLPEQDSPVGPGLRSEPRALTVGRTPRRKAPRQPHGAWTRVLEQRSWTPTVRCRGHSRRSLWGHLPKHRGTGETAGGRCPSGSVGTGSRTPQTPKPRVLEPLL